MKAKILLSFLVALFAITSLFAQEKTAITKAEDLPKHSYELVNKDAIAIVQSKETILELAGKVKKDIEADLEKYDIQDKASLKEYYSMLRIINILEGNYKKALDYIEKERKLAVKPSERLIRGMETEALLKSALQLNTLEPVRLSQNILQLLDEHIKNTDFSLIQEDIEESKGRLDILSENIILGFIQGETQNALNNNKGEIPGDLVTSLISYHYSLHYILPYKDIYQKAYMDAIDTYAEKIEKIDIWKEREVTLKPSDNNQPVVIAIWDSGIDTDVFPEYNIWTNQKEIPDGKDNDNNGFIDDMHGIAYDLKGNKDFHYVEPTAHNLPNVKELQSKLKGWMDMIANLDTQEAAELKQYLASLKPEKVNESLEELYLYAIYTHGTHVGGIAAAGNPNAKLMVARKSFDHKNIPDPPTDELVNRNAAIFGETIDYFKKNKVRVVNMSWGESYESILSVLEKNGVGDNDEERKALAKKYFDIKYEAFKKAVASAPEILFVAAAGNSNDDVDFSSYYPSSINLPNMLTVGAVDMEGKKASFTTEGESVDVFANGYEIESYVPGGDRVAVSGTSMASPQVANLAGKILTVNPSLTPVQVSDIIIKTATVSEEDENVLLVHPRNALEMAENLSQN